MYLFRGGQSSSTFLDAQKRLGCEFCGTNCGAPKARLIHDGLQNVYKAILCPQCDERFATCWEYRQHQNVHLITCEFCNEQFPRLKTYELHKLREHTIKVEPDILDAHHTDVPETNELDSTSRLKISHEYRRVDCSVCRKNCGTPKARLIHEASHRKERTLLCPQCNDPFPNYALYKRHKDGHLVTCEFCKKKFLSQYTCDFHKMKVHMNEEERAWKKMDMLKCKLCSKVFQDKRKLTAHLACHREPIFPCSFCEKKFKRKYDVQKHILIMHSDLDPEGIKCEICQRGFKTKNNLYLHLKIHKKQYAIYCEGCGKGFSCRSSHDAHYKHVHQGLRFKCDICEKSFTTEVYLQSHKRLHDPNYVKRKYNCDQCEQFFYNTSGLQNHIRVKHLNQLHVCEVCGKGLTNVVSLKNHMKIHTGEKPYVCAICGKAFNKRNLLATHNVVHTKEKPYACKFCDKTYTQRSPLTVHIKQAHSDERPFVCAICSKGFVMKSLLNMHMKTHEAVKKDD